MSSFTVSWSAIKQQRIFANLPESDVQNLFTEMAENNQTISKDNFIKLLNAFYVGFVFDVQLSQVPKSDLTNALENLKFIFEKKVNQEKGVCVEIAGLCDGKLTRNSEQQFCQQNRIHFTVGPIQRKFPKYSHQRF